MQEYSWIIAALFLPLFPLSMIFNALFQRLRLVWMRVVLLLLWPIPGVWILQGLAPEIPGWIVYWALVSAVLYGFRAVVIKEFGVWIGFLATSAWALNWISLAFDASRDEMLVTVFAFSLPLSLLALLVAELEKRYESAYVSVINGLAQAQPRLSILFVITVLAVIGSPLFPAFFSMLDAVARVMTILPVLALGLAIVWLLWSWSGISLLQQLLVGSSSLTRKKDLSFAAMMIYGVSLLALVFGGLQMARVLL